MNMTQNITNVLVNESRRDNRSFLLFVFGSFTVGALVRTLLRRLPLPYMAIMMFVGCIIGTIMIFIPSLGYYLRMVIYRPEDILDIFLPILIFETTFNMKIHMFKTCLPQILLLALPGFLLSCFLMCLFCLYVLLYNWSWYTSLMFGSLISTTDSIAVMPLLRASGGCKQVSTILEGESLLTMCGAAITFHVLYSMAVAPPPGKGVNTIILVLRLVVSSSLFGYIVGKLTTLWLAYVVNDTTVEIVVTFCSTYVAFILADSWLGISGVVSLVVMGITVSAGRQCISPEVETFLHRFWDVLKYMACSSIYVLVGVVVSEKLRYPKLEDWFRMGALYCLMLLSRAVIVAVSSPLLIRLGRDFSWRSAVVVSWSALRGTLSLALALSLLNQKQIDSTGHTQNSLFLHCVVLVALNLLINSTSLSPLLKLLGLNEISMPKRLAMASAVRHLKDIAQKALKSYQADTFLADAEWDVVKKYVEIQDPYKTVEEEAALDDLTNFNLPTTCPLCITHVACEPSIQELREMLIEARLRIIKVEKVSYWKQYQRGMLSKEAADSLVHLVDNIVDYSKPDKVYINKEDIVKTWKIPKFHAFLKKKFERWRLQKPNKEAIKWPKNKICKMALKICLQPAFDITMYTIIIINVIFVISELVTGCPRKVYALLFDIANYVFIFIYTVEATIKITAYAAGYFRDYWNLFDFFVLVVSFVEVIVDLTLFAHVDCNYPNNSTVKTYFSPTILKLAKIVRLLRLIRSLRLIKVLILPLLGILDHKINRKIRFGYDVGVAYIRGEEDVINNIDIMVTNSRIAEKLKTECYENKEQIIKELGLLQKNHPGIGISIKTQQAARRILNNLRDDIKKLKDEGVIDEVEANKLYNMIEVKMKKLLKIPASIAPPSPEKILSNLSWIAGDQELINYIKNRSELVTMQEGEQMDVESEPRGGIYLIISGQIKVDRFVTDYSHDSREEEESYQPFYEYYQALDFAMISIDRSRTEMTSDYLSTGAVLGEYSLLTGKKNSTIITCDTSVQMYHVDYDTIKAALEMFAESPSLEHRLWRVAAQRIAVPIIRKHSYFKEWDLRRVKMHLENGVLVTKTWQLSDGTKSLQPCCFHVGSLIKTDVILVHGYAQNPDTTSIYRGPCYIPQGVNVIYLLPGRTESHILFIVYRDAALQAENDEVLLNDKLEVLHSTTEDRTTSGSSKIKPGKLCLLHSAIERKELEAKASERRLQLESSRQSRLFKKVSRLLNRGRTNGTSACSSSNAPLQTGKHKKGSIAITKSATYVKDRRILKRKVSPLDVASQTMGKGSRSANEINTLIL